MTVLNRIVEWTNAGIQYEADPRHVDLIIEDLGLESANGSGVTGSKVDINETDTESDHEDAYRFRSIAARLNFLAADRIDLQFASKEICRRMSSPCMSDWAKVRKLERYLRKHARQVLWFAWQDVQSNRRSTNGGLVMHGSHLLKTWASTQTVVALSSGEAEYYGVVKGMCEALETRGLRRTWASTSASLYPPILPRRRGSQLGRAWGRSNIWRPGRCGRRTRSMRV